MMGEEIVLIGIIFLILVLNIPIISFIDKRLTNLEELESNPNDWWLEFHYKNALEKQREKYNEDIGKLREEIKELEEKIIIQETTINVLNSIIKQCLTGAIKENTNIIQELEELEKQNKRKGEII